MIERIRNWQDHEEWMRFFEKYGPFIYRRAVRRGLTDVEASEVVQDTMLGIAKKIQDYKKRPGIPFKNWLNSIVSKRISTQFSAREKNTVSLNVTSDGRLNPSIDVAIAPGISQQDEQWERDWEENLLRAAMQRVRARIRPQHFQIYEYHVIKGRSAQETARDLNASIAQVYVVKFRVSNALKREMRQLMQEPI